jgi:hypothetical protein
VRVRGNAWQVYEKYQSLARDAQGAGDRVLAESLLQHAEHYYRVIEAIEEATLNERPRPSSAPQNMSDQPDVPPDYFAPAGQIPNAPQPEQPQKKTWPESRARRDNPMNPPSQDEATKKPADPFFMEEDKQDEDNGPQKLIVGN